MEMSIPKNRLLEKKMALHWILRLTKNLRVRLSQRRSWFPWYRRVWWRNERMWRHCHNQKWLGESARDHFRASPNTFLPYKLGPKSQQIGRFGFGNVPAIWSPKSRKIPRQKCVESRSSLKPDLGSNLSRNLVHTGSEKPSCSLDPSVEQKVPELSDLE